MKTRRCYPDIRALLFKRILELAKEIGLRRKNKFDDLALAIYKTRYWSLPFAFTKIREMLQFSEHPIRGWTVRMREIGWWEQRQQGKEMRCLLEFRRRKFELSFYFDKYKAKIQII